MSKKDRFLKWLMVGSAIMATVCFAARGEWSGAIWSSTCGVWAFLYFEYYDRYHTLVKHYQTFQQGMGERNYSKGEDNAKLK